MERGKRFRLPSAKSNEMFSQGFSPTPNITPVPYLGGFWRPWWGGLSLGVIFWEKKIKFPRHFALISPKFQHFEAKLVNNFILPKVSITWHCQKMEKFWGPGTISLDEGGCIWLPNQSPQGNIFLGGTFGSGHCLGGLYSRVSRDLFCFWVARGKCSLLS